MAWANSTRSKRLPGNWKTLRARILRRDPICRICNAAPSTECDHIVNNDDHSPENLRGVCAPCHQAKTRLESRAGIAKRPTRKRMPEPHPGLIPRSP